MLCYVYFSLSIPCRWCLAQHRHSLPLTHAGGRRNAHKNCTKKKGNKKKIIFDIFAVFFSLLFPHYLVKLSLKKKTLLLQQLIFFASNPNWIKLCPSGGNAKSGGLSVDFCILHKFTEISRGRYKKSSEREKIPTFHQKNVIFQKF